MSWACRMLLMLITGVLCGCALSDAAEIGFDLGVTAQLDREHDVVVGLPRPGRQIRVGLALSDRDELEIAPTFTYSSSEAATPRSSIPIMLSVTS